MTLTLILIRHAKSSWDDPLAQDHDRNLNNRGRRSADAVGQWLKAQDCRPDEVLCSTASRAVETWEGVGAHVGEGADLKYLSGLYHAAPETMLEALKGANGNAVAMVGHNPGIAILAEQLAQAPPDHSDFFRYPTAATTLFTFNLPEWSDVGWNSGAVRGFVVPRELTD